MADSNTTSVWYFRKEHQESMQAMRTHMEGVLSTLLQLNRDEQKEQNKEFRMLFFSLYIQIYA